MSFLALFRTLIFWFKNQSFLSKISKNDLYKLVPPPPKKSLMLEQKPWIIFSGLKIIRFYPKYQKTIFSDFIVPRNPYEKKFDISTKTMDYPPYENV